MPSSRPVPSQRLCAFPLVGWALCTVALCASAAAGDASLANAIHVRVNGRPIVRQDVQDVGNLIVRTRFDGRVPADEKGRIEIEAEAVRQLVRAFLILEEMKRYPEIKVDKEEYLETLKYMGIEDATKVPPGVRFLAESQVVFPWVLTKKNIPRYQPAPEEIRRFYQQHRSTIFREPGFVKLRRMLFFEAPGQSRAELLRDVADRIIAFMNLPRHPTDQRTPALDEYIKKNSQDVFAESGGYMPLEREQGPGWAAERFGYVNPDTGERPFDEPVMKELERLIRAGVRGSFTPPVSTELGVQVVYLEDVRPGKTQTFAEARRQIEYILSDYANGERGQKWLRRKHENSKITWNDGQPYTIDELIPPAKSNRERAAEG